MRPGIPVELQVIVDGKFGPEFDRVVKGGPTFRANRAVEYLAIRDGVLYRVRHDL
jgi:hypothetical protein